MRNFGVPVLLLVALGSSFCVADELRPDQDDADLRSVAQVGGRVSWAVGDRGTAFRSHDSGKTWSSVSLPVTLSCRSVCFLTNQVGWIAGNDERPGRQGGVVLATRDGGKLWQVSYPPMKRICYVRFYDLEHGLLVGGGDDEHPSGVIETHDGGRTWQAVGGNRSGRLADGGCFKGSTGSCGGRTVSGGSIFRRSDPGTGRSIRREEGLVGFVNFCPGNWLARRRRRRCFGENCS